MLCRRIATDKPWHVSNRQIHKDLGVPCSITSAYSQSVNSKLVAMEKPSTYLQFCDTESTLQTASQAEQPEATEAQLASPDWLNEVAKLPYPDWGIPWWVSDVRLLPR